MSVNDRARLPVAAVAAWFALGGAALAQAPAGLTEADFRTGTTAALARLCAPAAEDPARVFSMGFCHGQFVAVGQLHRELTQENGPFRPFFCLPEPSPALSEIVARYVAWTQANQQHAAESAVDGILRFAAEISPCPPPALRPAPRAGAQRR